MKRLLTLLALVLCSCAETFVGEEVARPNNANLPDLTASFADEEATRTYIEEGKYLRWNEDDRLTIFFGNTLNRQYKFNGKTGDNSGTFSLVPDGMLGTGNAFDHIYALYPYNADARITDEGVITLTLPAEQNYAENSFGRGANTMLAVTENVEDTFLSFKNTCGYLKLKLYNAEGASIKSIEVKGNSGERLAGAATATIAFGEAPVLAMADDATTSVTLNCGEGVALGTTAETATEFWVVLPATTFAEGLTITAIDTEGKVFKKSTAKEVVIERNAIQPMAALVAECTPPGPADNEIWYTNGSTTEATTPYKTDVFGANIASNTYDAEKECWVIMFDGDVTTIGNYAFRGCTSLTSVTIPDSITTIGNYAFYQCSSLTSVNIGDSVTTIGYYAFQYCSSLKEFTGKFATEDGRSLIIDNTIIAYANASGTTYTIPDSVTTIGDSAFAYCSNLTSVTIPDSVTTIGYEAFSRCWSLTSVTISDSVTEISRQAFDNCSSITSITIPNSVTKIGEWAFANCNSLTSVTIGNGVTEIGNCAFVGCYNLQEFRGNSASEDGRCIIIDGVLNSFAKASLTEYTIPDSVTSIGSSAFYGCSSLTSVTIPDSVTEIGNSAFYGCSSLTSITIPDSVTKIGSTAFRDCSSITSITIPNSVTEIGGSAFSGCTGELFVNCNISESAIGYSSFSSVTIGDGVTTIGDYAFYSCDSLTSVTIPDSVTNIGFYAFFNCSNLSYVYCKRFTPPITTMTTSGFWDAFDNTNYYLKIFVPSVSSKSLYKDTAGWSKYKDKFVEYIFEQDIDSEMPLKPTEYEIWYTTSFHNYEPYQNSLNPFNVDIISLTYNTNSKYWIIKLDNKVTKINDSAFEATGRWMTGIFLPDSITEIGKCAFNNCFELSNINLPSNIISIGKWAFHYCTSLTSLTIPESIETIESYAFAYCSSLTSVYCKATTPPNGGESMFDSNASDRKIYVPMESVEAYKSASYWKNYADDIVGYNF